MSTSFSANQYDDAFRPRKLRNWQSPKMFDEMPRTLNGTAAPIANDQGHLRPQFRRSKTDPWGTFIGTWDLPKQLPGNYIDVPTGRSQQAYDKLRNDWETSRVQLTGSPWGTINNTMYRQGTRSLILTRADGTQSKTQSRQGSTTGSRKLSPIERAPSTGDKADDAASQPAEDGDVTQHQLSNKIPLPRLDRPVYAEDSKSAEVMCDAAE